MERILSQESKETYFFLRFEDEVMARKCYPFFSRILDGNDELICTQGLNQARNLCGYEVKII